MNDNAARALLIYRDGRGEFVPRVARRWLVVSESGGDRCFHVVGEARRDDEEPGLRVYVERPAAEYEREPDPAEASVLAQARQRVSRSPAEEQHGAAQTIGQRLAALGLVVGPGVAGHTSSRGDNGAELVREGDADPRQAG